MSPHVAFLPQDDGDFLRSIGHCPSAKARTRNPKGRSLLLGLVSEAGTPVADCGGPFPRQERQGEDAAVVSIL